MTGMIEERASVPPRLFRDRKGAAEVLAGYLAHFLDKGALVLGIPRGGVPVAAEVALALNAEMDIIVARKLGSPVSAELAIGAVTANGGRFLDEDAIRELDVSDEYLARLTEEEKVEARRREEQFRGSRPAPTIRDRIVILVDDGLATGATMRAAVRSVRQSMPARLVVAVPVAPPQACRELRNEADEVVCPYQPDPFWAVGMFYGDFTPTEDSEVESLLGQAYDRQQTKRAAQLSQMGGNSSSQRESSTEHDKAAGSRDAKAMAENALVLEHLAEAPAQLWGLGITELAGHNIEAHGRDEVNKMLKEGWTLLHIYTLHYQDDGIWRQRPMAILGRSARAEA